MPPSHLPCACAAKLAELARTVPKLWEEPNLDPWHDLWDTYLAVLKQQPPSKGRSQALTLARNTLSRITAAKKLEQTSQVSIL